MKFNVTSTWRGFGARLENQTITGNRGRLRGLYVYAFGRCFSINFN